MNSEDRLFLEFRTSQDAERPKEFGQHYRRYIDPDDFEKEEDAHVARFVAAPTVDG